MEGTYIIEVVHKPGVVDPLGNGLSKNVHHVIKGVKKIETAPLYRLMGNLSQAELSRIGSDLLADPVIQTCRDAAVPCAHEPGKSNKPAVSVDVWYKHGVTDAVGESVLKGIRDLNINSVREVRTGMRYRFYGIKDSSEAGKITLAFLANPLIHEWTIHSNSSVS
jgi:phosphoribosylformylglycinamidine (FGAM) synthase PurS component